MKISLARANKLRNTISTLSLSPAKIVTIRNNNDNIIAIIKKHQRIFRLKIEKTKELISFKYKLQKYISQENDACGVTDLIFSIAASERLVTVLEGIIAAGSRYGSTPSNSLQEVQDAIIYAKRLEEVDNTKIFKPSLMNVSLIDDDLKAAVEKEIRETKKSVEEMKERRNTLNYSRYIEIPEEQVALLREFDLV